MLDLQKNVQRNEYYFQYLREQWNDPIKIIFLHLWGLVKKLRSKEATWSKNENSVKPKENLYINFLKENYLLS